MCWRARALVVRLNHLPKASRPRPVFSLDHKHVPGLPSELGVRAMSNGFGATQDFPSSSR